MMTTESVIRRMTRLAVANDAVNLAQGFTDEPPPYPVVWAAVSALLGGTDKGIERLSSVTVADLKAGPRDASVPLGRALEAIQNPRDRLNQYSFPFGLAELRGAIADYTHHHYGFRPDPETETTVVLGATEGLAVVLGGIGRSGDGVIVFQPFHEMYPAQAEVFGLRPVFATLRESRGRWHLDREELARAVRDARMLVLNTPHNPTGKVFTLDELNFIATLAIEHDIVVVSDEIYEQITYDGHRHVSPASLPQIRDRTIVVNSIFKTGNATGWRVGWVIANEAWTTQIRGVHDTLVIQAPTPLQKAAVKLLDMPEEFFDQLRRDYRVKREVLRAAVQQVGFRVSTPEGAYYLFADYRSVTPLASLTPMEAAMFVIERAGVASVPGDNFYAAGWTACGYLRFAFCRSLDTLTDAGRRLGGLG